MQMLNRQRGIGLLELMLVLLIIAVVLFMATRYYETTRLNSRVAAASTMINSANEASYEWLKGAPNFQGISTQVLVTAGFLAENYANADANPWNGKIDVEPWGADNQHVLIKLSNVPLKACRLLELRLKAQAYQQQISQCAGSSTDFWVVF